MSKIYNFSNLRKNSKKTHKIKTFSDKKLYESLALLAQNYEFLQKKNLFLKLSKFP